MTVGGQAGSGTVDQRLTDLATTKRDWAFRVQNLQKQYGTLAALQAVGYSPADAQTALNYINFMNNLAAVYYGTGTQASPSNFDAAFAPLWAGQ
jgi:hypothetical protein